MDMLLLQLLGRPWLMEESQAHYWADIAQKMLFEKSMSAVPGRPDLSNWFARIDSAGNYNQAGPVMMMKVAGPLMQQDYCGSPGMWTMEQAIISAQRNDNIQSIVLWIDSPGGTVSGTENFAKAIKASKKPIVAFVNTMMCSAAYWIGSSTREIVADNANKGFNTMIGSIGTKIMVSDNSKEMEQRGVKVTSITASKSKRKGKYSEDILAGDYTRLQKDLDNINETFISAVKVNREGRLVASTEDVFEGDTYNAKQALQLGLIDKIADFQYAVKRSLQLANTLS